ncbi:MAG: c-type cytochrome [Anaerolineae bacterium]|nr:c-type cytochrome [Anaerolineae bacterium]
MRKFSLIMLLVVALVMVLAACGGGGDSADSGSGDAAAPAGGDAARGEALYKQTIIGEASAPGCITCHSLDEGVVLVGPSHAGMGARANGAVAGLSADQYLEQSITEPNAHITDGYTEGVMYQFYGNDLSAQEIADLVAFLKTQ